MLGQSPIPTVDPDKTSEALRKALPAREWQAVRAWLTTFYPYQLRWLLDWNRFAVVLKARQIGASHTYAAAACLWALLGETTTVISKGEREALEVVESASKHSRVLAALGSHWATPGGKDAAQEVRFASGGRIVALPSTSGGRGFSGNVILDEFAYHVDPAKVWDGAAAVVMHGYKMRVMSTPNGVGNLFHQLWTDPATNKGYVKHAVTLAEAQADGLRVSDETCWSMARGDRHLFDQLFNCSFLFSGRNFFDVERAAALTDAAAAPIATQIIREGGAVGQTVNNVEIPAIRVWHYPEPGRQYVIGVDVSEGTGGDAGAGIVLERGTGRHMATIWGQFRPWELGRVAAAVGRKYNGALVTVERNNHGHACLRALQAEHRYERIFADRDEKPGWLNTEVTRSPTLDTFEQAFRLKHFTTNDRFLLSEMRTFTVNDRGRAEAAKGSHDDLVMAAAIAWDVICRPAPSRGETASMPVM